LLLKTLRGNLRYQLHELDAKHPELAFKAQAAGMKTLGELEYFPAKRIAFACLYVPAEPCFLISRLDSYLTKE
jgi:hypothetical protein